MALPLPDYLIVYESARPAVPFQHTKSLGLWRILPVKPSAGTKDGCTARCGVLGVTNQEKRLSGAARRRIRATVWSVKTRGLDR